MINRRSMAVWIVLTSLGCSISLAGKYNQKLDIGDAAPKWEKLAGVDGEAYSFDDFSSAKILVVVFTSNTCPYAHDYEKRLKQFQSAHGTSGEVKLVVLNPNAVRDDSLNAMKEYGKKQAFNFTYLKDEDGQVATSYGALRTPECFVIDANREIIYMGAFDDNSNADRVKVSYVDEVIAAALKGEAPEVRETPPVGCLIRQHRRR